ncbi:Fur family transcriptional regulator [Gracilibacillus halophilus YIM-C55.5]|uniref:Fur family transcriptional regulator n=1 Tax=Gracilibacillus halophilus YIM-C55.5 TaxID=1308866 RepID=N4WUU5_9BACI|nr:Fur family transcriptional regulator [Gracilibacillus halophilus]ENH96886.1 Fur family transcriptional regulator [Gracilibacillus halophilus YIM-C55.5]
MNVNTAIQKLKEKGYKHTKQREQILNILVNKDHYIAAKEIIERIKQHFPNVSYDTIYRNLYLLTNEELLEMTDLHGEKHFRIMCHSKGHHHHLICNTCGKTKTIDFCPMDIVDDKLEGYQIDTHKFEIYGLCPQCL